MQGDFSNGGYATISAEYLYPGLLLQEDIYDADQRMLLVAKGVVLSENMIEQLKRQLKSGQAIRVSAKLRTQLLAVNAPQQSKQIELERNVGYTEVVESTESLMKVTEVTKQVPHQQVVEISGLTLNKIDAVAPALIFQCINGRNEVDEYLYRHSANIGMINGLMGKWMGLSQEDTENLVMVGIVHDVGKLRTPPEILNKPGRLTRDEFEVIKGHPMHSHEILRQSPHFSPAICAAARYHHERMNGAGYPDGLRADNIPLYARITAVSDVYDAMVSKRIYKDAVSPFAVLTQMRAEQYGWLDMRLMNIFTEYMPRELVGQTVLMSDGSEGVVRYVNDNNIEFPFVEVDGEVIITNKDFYCVSMLIE